MRTHLLSEYGGRDLGAPDKLLGVRVTVDAGEIALDLQLRAQSIVFKEDLFGRCNTQSR